MMDDVPTAAQPTPARPSSSPHWLPRIGSPAYHVMLSVVAILILGPLGGISAAFMNFSIGFYVGGQVLAGILGSAVTLPYGPEGKHGANYMQTMAASVAGMCGMSALVQAMVWMGLPQPPMWQMVLYFMCIGMFGVGLGMLYTPILVDRLQLTYPSGLAVANILRALTDKELLKRSIFKLAGSLGSGFGMALAAAKITSLNGLRDLSVSTLGGGMIVGARIALPALWVALIGIWQTPHLLSIGWLDPGDHYRAIGFIISLGAIMGAAMLDVGLILVQAVRRFRETGTTAAEPAPDWKRVNMMRLIMWVVFWGAGTVIMGNQVLQQPVLFLLVAIGLCFVFVLVNGIALGISDFNPISSAFVMSVLIMAAVGLRNPGVGLFCAAILAIATAEGGDMQQDRSTGWRLGTNRAVQFRYQVIGIAMGALMMVILARLFMHAYPILNVDQRTHKNLPSTIHWQSAFTYKMVGALRGIVESKPRVMRALCLGIGIGLLMEIIRKLIKNRPGYKKFAIKNRGGRVTSFLLDAVFLPSPYAFAFGGFVELPTIIWWAAGGGVASIYELIEARLWPPAKRADGALPSDMSTMSLVGGGFIAGDALAALAIGVYGILQAIQ
ncbi:MAG TPA: OPT/YSL family transporter [Verrucomicrobiae bacterium]|jgi:uncharacterized oligopeptide transporter (OPT) family protein|nr:OPT/YSL family transporter [Verrucomicrobiae bacterium]